MNNDAFTDDLAPIAAPPLTVEALAAYKRLPVELLADGFGIFPHWEGGLSIPYYDPNTLRVRTRIRSGLTGGTMKWDTKDRDVWSIVPYGLQRLDDARAAGRWIIVEGESDVWTLFYHGIAGLGIPGASMYDYVMNEHVAGVDRIYIHREQKAGGDGGGKTFADGMCNQLRSFKFTGEVFVFSIWDQWSVKDPSDLHIANPDLFNECFERSIAGANRVDLSALPPPRSKSNGSRIPVTTDSRPCSNGSTRGNHRSSNSGHLNEQLKSIDLGHLIAQETGQSFRNGKLRCCFHDDRTPSLSVYTGKDGVPRFKCHGCGARGNAIDFLRRRYGMSFQEAKERMGINPIPPKSQIAELPKPPTAEHSSPNCHKLSDTDKEDKEDREDLFRAHVVREPVTFQIAPPRCCPFAEPLFLKHNTTFSLAAVLRASP